MSENFLDCLKAAWRKMVKQGLSASDNNVLSNKKIFQRPEMNTSFGERYGFIGEKNCCADRTRGFTIPRDASCRNRLGVGPACVALTQSNGDTVGILANHTAPLTSGASQILKVEDQKLSVGVTGKHAARRRPVLTYLFPR